MRDTKWNGGDDEKNLETVAAAAEAQGEIVGNNDSEGRCSKVSEHRIIGPPIDETSSSKYGKGGKDQTQQ